MKTIRLFVIAAISAAMFASCKATPDVDVEMPSSDQVDSVSYLIGVNFGYFLKANNFAAKLSDINMTAVKAGMNDFINAKGRMDSDEFKAGFKIDPDTMNDVFNEYIEKRSAYIAAVNAKEGESFLEKKYNEGGVEKTESGLLYQIIEAGSDVKAVADADTVWCQYKGTLIDGTEFDASDPEGEPVRFILNRVIAGWTEGLKLVGEGGKIKLYVPAELAYGERGAGEIKPNSTLIFDVEVTKVGKTAPVEEAEEAEEEK